MMRIKALVFSVGSSDAGVGDELSMIFSVSVVPGMHPLQLYLLPTGPRPWCLAERTDGLSLALIGVVGRSPATVPGISHYFGLKNFRVVASRLACQDRSASSSDVGMPESAPVPGRLAQRAGAIRQLSGASGHGSGPVCQSVIVSASVARGVTGTARYHDSR
jgi:hypothetical protein